MAEGRGEGRPHAIQRTSAPGKPFLGTCTICHTVGLAEYQRGEYCPGTAPQIQGYGKTRPEANGEAAGGIGSGGVGRRAYRDRGETRNPVMGVGDSAWEGMDLSRPFWGKEETKAQAKLDKARLKDDRNRHKARHKIEKKGRWKRWVGLKR